MSRMTRLKILLILVVVVSMMAAITASVFADPGPYDWAKSNKGIVPISVSGNDSSSLDPSSTYMKFESVSKHPICASCQSDNVTAL